MRVQVKISGLAIAAFVLGILSIFTLGLTAIPAIVLGIIALVAIEKSGGRLTGLAFAIIGIVLPVFSFFVVLGILMPALARTRQLAFRMTCGTNLSGIGKAMVLYADDHEDELPRAGGRNTQWGATPKWAAPDRRQAFGLAADGTGGSASISSCFYLLVKYAEVTPKSFICKGDAGTTEFKLTDQTGVASGFELIDAWDFGPASESFKHCSYSYHIPFGFYALTTSGEPGVAVAADRNPWIISPAAAAGVFADFKPDAGATGGTGTSDQAKKGNAINHQNDGQNVLFLDSHVEFAKRSYCSIEDDNIYTVSRNATMGDAWGTQPVPAAGLTPTNRKDSLLVHDPDTFGSAGSSRPATRTSSN
jgi:hypothetical protein